MVIIDEGLILLLGMPMVIIDEGIDTFVRNAYGYY